MHHAEYNWEHNDLSTSASIPPPTRSQTSRRDLPCTRRSPSACHQDNGMVSDSSETVSIDGSTTQGPFVDRSGKTFDRKPQDLRRR